MIATLRQRRLVRRDAKTCLGALLLVHFAFLCVVKLLHGTPEQIWWLSNITLITAGAGLFLHSRLLTMTALTNVAVLHLIWLVDLVAWWITGHFPVGMAAYLQEADLLGWLASGHHFFLLPILATVFLIDQRYPAETLPLAACVFLMLTIFSRAALPPPSNINCACFVPESMQWYGFEWLDRLPGAYYLLGLNATATLGAFVPAAAVCFLAGRQNRTAIP